MYTTHTYTIDWREFDFDFPDKAGFPKPASDGFRAPVESHAPHHHDRSSSESGEPP